MHGEEGDTGDNGDECDDNEDEYSDDDKSLGIWWVGWLIRWI